MFTKYVRPTLAAAALGAFLLATGCAGTQVGVGYRVYDPYTAQYRVWTPAEGVYYQRWAAETHRNPHRDFRRLGRRDREEYWRWRRDQSDRRYRTG